ncbi:MAG TPA: MBL fold metallo-hydrolase [Candidatus Desulfofervidus auxilii]|uniref:MBL fold metallo-hydrolase n=1 Tax=Desulfofervidus auxilii TaxID=1621989 RepID=A0A7V0IAH7_DESA2|nr:MBL fold metallo-hydrolase [Candidatus Desulfofervidus auxilii]
MPEIIIVGSGTGIPRLERGSPAIVFKTPHATVLLDSGPGTLRELLKINIPFLKLDLLIYTHLHPDHVTDLIHFLFVSQCDFRREKPVFIWGPPGFLKFHAALKEAFGHWVAPEKVILSEVSPNTLWAYEDIEIEPFKTVHTENSQGYILRTEGKKICYTGDTDYNEDLIELLYEADLLICEASFPSFKKVDGHLTPDLAGKLANSSKVKYLLLTHIYPECDTVDIAAECRKYYKGPLFIAQDLLRIKI